jgi:FkbM family methyltransferase
VNSSTMLSVFIECEDKAIIGALSSQGAEFKAGRLDLPAFVNRIKIDVGLSGNAPNSFAWLNEDPVGLLVIAFEPVKKNLIALNQLIDSVPNPSDLRKRFWILPFALGSSYGSSQIHVTADAGQSSLLIPKDTSIIESQGTVVVTLEQFLKLIPEDRFPIIDFLKTDCQGTDLEVLRGAGSQLQRIVVITVEADAYSYKRATNSIFKIRRYMKRHDFTQLNPRPFYRVILGNILQRLPWLHSRIAPHINSPVKQSNLGKVIFTEDPTFVNEKLKSLLETSSISAYQKG